MMKYIDKFLKFLKTDRNTFLTYILTLATIYIAVDRVVEILFLVFTGMSLSYWGPIAYTLALACPVFAFLFSGSSKFVKGGQLKITFFYLYCIALYLISLSMIMQWVNQFVWLFILSVPNYSVIATQFSELFSPAFTAIAVFLPLTTFYPVFKWLFTTINDTRDIQDSIMDFGGLNLAETKEGTGPYTCEVVLCKDSDTGKLVKIPEVRRFESLLIIGASGSRQDIYAVRTNDGS